MLTMRKEQMDVFDRIAALEFQERLVEYVRKSFPAAFSELGAQRVREIVRFACEKAKEYELSSERGCRLYASMVFVLGAGFDKDPQFPWAGEILTDAASDDPNLRIDKLYDKTMDYSRQVAGDKGEKIESAMIRLCRADVDILPNFKDAPGLFSEPFENRILTLLGKIHPEKYAYLGEDRARKLIRSGIEAAKRYDISTERGVAGYIGLMYMLGSGFDTDLKFPWAAEILEDETIEDPRLRAERLCAKASALVRERLESKGAPRVERPKG